MHIETSTIGLPIKQLSASERPGQPQVQEVQDCSFIRRAISGKEIHFGHRCNFNIFLINSKSRVILMQICSHPRFLAVTKLIAQLPLTSCQKNSLHSVCAILRSPALIFLPHLCFIGVLYTKQLIWN